MQLNDVQEGKKARGKWVDAKLKKILESIFTLNNHPT